MLAKALKIGDVVKIIGGGPNVTVINIPSPQTAQVAWFDKQLSLRSAEVTINSLKKVGK